MSFFRTFKSPDRFAGDGAGEILLELFDYDGAGNIVYQGCTNQAHGNEEEEIWAIAKFSYNGENQLIRTEYRYTVAWSERAIIDWIV